MWPKIQLDDRRSDFLRTARFLMQLVWDSSPKLFVTLICVTLLGGLLPPLNLILNSEILNTLITAVQSPFEWNSLTIKLIMLLAGVGGVFLLGQYLVHLNGGIQALFQSRVTNHVRQTIARKSASLDLSSFEDPEFYNVMRIASGEASFRPLLVVRQLLTLASMVTTLASLAIVLGTWQPWIVLVVIVSSLATLWVSAYFGRARVEMTIDRSELDRKIQYFQTELSSDQSAKEVRLFGLQMLFIPLMDKYFELIHRQDKALVWRQIQYNGVLETILSAVQPLLIGFVALQATLHFVSIGQFSLYSGAIVFFYSGIKEFMSTIGQLHESNLYVRNLLSFLSLEARVESRRPNSEKYRAQISRRPLIEFRNVSFRYPDSRKPAVTNLSFSIAPGEIVALVGDNGAGKTTIVKLLAGLYEPTEGQILFDGIDAKLLSREDLRSFLGVIFQDFGIYHLSVFDNVGIGDIERIDEHEAIRQAARKTGLDTVVENLPYGYDTVIGRYFDFGQELSGGQRQLVALTRLSFRDVPVLVLDEPSASLDVFAEQKFYRSLLLNRGTVSQSVLVISHRFTTVRLSGRIIVLKGGRIIEEGSHEELMLNNGHYSSMFKLQMDMYKEDHVANKNSEGYVNDYETKGMR